MQTTSIPAPAAGAVDSVLHALLSIGRLMRQRVPGDTLDPGTYFLLKSISGRGSLRLTDLATCSNLDASTVSRHVTQLHRQGLLDRTPDPDDRRAQRVALSALGEERLQEALAQRRALLTRSLADWNDTDIEDLDRLLARFVGDIERLPTELEPV
jgi:DNA-binding MarR family transcriptional regulator